MNQATMPGLNAGGAPFGGTPMMPNGSNGALPRPGIDHDEINYEAKLNSYIYGYFIDRKLWDMARALKNSGVQFFPALDGSLSGAEDSKMHETKNGLDSKRPDDLPEIPGTDNAQGGSFLLGWFSLFWDIYWAQRPPKEGQNKASRDSVQYVNQAQAMARSRNDAQQSLLRGMPNMMPGQMTDYQRLMIQQNMQMNESLRQKAMQNNRNGFPANAQQLAQMRNAQQNQLMQMQMRRDPSDMNRPRTPSAGDHSNSPSKRQRMEGAPFNGQQMLQNGRPPGMPVPPMMGDPAQNANQLLMNNGINPGNLSDAQFASFQQQNPAVQQKSIQVYAQQLAKNQRDSMSKAGGMSEGGSPMMAPGMEMGVGGPDFYGGNNPAAMQMRAGGVPPAGGVNGAGGNHALQDYQMQLMLLEQQNKKRLLMARQEQDTNPNRPDGQQGLAGFAPAMSPQGSRGGPSPGPNEQPPARRGTPKMNQAGLPGSPLPDGSMRGSPATMNFNGMNPEIYAHMNGGGMRPPPSSNPGFNMTPQQAEQMRAGRMANGGWQQGPQGQPPMMPQGGPPPQPPQMGTPQQRNEMPPPQGPPPGIAANGGRPGSPAAPPTPQQSNKPNPKKKDQKERKKPVKKGSIASVAATPASEAEQPPTPTPATPVTPSHPNSFAAKNEQPGQTNGIPAPAAQLPQAPPDPNATPQFGTFDETHTDLNMAFNADPESSLLDTFDFEQFLQGDVFNFDTTNFDIGDGIETGMGEG